jgi:glycosyltransferase involved in cell wall biosynthesis
MFNGAAYLAEAIESVLTQTFSDWELIVIDDGSSDDSLSIAQSYTDPRIRILKNPQNLGLPLTRNRGLDEARGRYVAFLDCDDIALPQRLQEQINFLEANPGIAAVGASVQPIDANGLASGPDWRSPGNAAYCKTRLLFGAYFVTSSFTARAEIFRTDRFDPSIPLAEDFDLYNRLCARHCLVNLPQTLIQYRIHGNNVTSTRRQALRQSLEEINRRQLAALAILPTARELQLHRHIEWLDLEPDMELLTEVSAWLLRVIKQNQQTAVYDFASLEKITSERWHAVCESALRKGYRPAWPAYYRSSLCGKKALGVMGHAKLASRMILPRLRGNRG